jgi:F0F1-type ATP synthase epsilon subunit
MVDQENNEITYDIGGGVIEVKANKIILLADTVR